MVKKIFIFAVLLIIVVSFGFSQNENWGEIRNLADVQGTWQGNAVSVVTSYFDLRLNSKLNISMTFEYNGGKTVDSVVKVDFTDLLIDLVNLPEIKSKGLSQDFIWNLMMEEVSADSVLYDVTYGRYCFYFYNTESAESYFASDSYGVFLINEAKDTLHLIYIEPVLVLGFGDLGFTEMIFKRIY